MSTSWERRQVVLNFLNMMYVLELAKTGVHWHNITLLLRRFKTEYPAESPDYLSDW